MLYKLFLLNKKKEKKKSYWATDPYIIYAGPVILQAELRLIHLQNRQWVASQSQFPSLVLYNVAIPKRCPNAEV